MTFEQLNLAQPIFKAILACGYKTPTPVQASAIPEVLKGSDVVASAQTGTGKTAAFVLPALHHLITHKKVVAKKGARILILTPTRELASQITRDVRTYGKFVRLNLAHLIGGTAYHHQIRDLSRPVDIIIATPGRLLDHVRSGRLDLSTIEMFILDEADRMLDMGFIEDVQTIAKSIKHRHQTLLFSATIDRRLSNVIKQLLIDPVRVDLSQKLIAPQQIKQLIYIADNQSHKMKLFQQFLTDEQVFKAIIFSATKMNADRLAMQLIQQGLKADALHGDLKQNKRNRVVEQLRLGKIQYLVATDVAARGIDIADISHVINFDLPRACEDYVHRIGRTGRAGKSGEAVSFAIPADIRHLQRIEKYTNLKLVCVNDPDRSFEKSGKKHEHQPHQRKRRAHKKSDDLEGYSYKKKKQYSGSSKEYSGASKEYSGSSKQHAGSSKDKEYSGSSSSRFNPKSAGRFKSKTTGKFKDSFKDAKESTEKFNPKSSRKFKDSKESTGKFSGKSSGRFKSKSNGKFKDAKESSSKFSGKSSGKFNPKSYARKSKNKTNLSDSAA